MSMCPQLSMQVLFDWLRLESKLPFDKVILENVCLFRLPTRPNCEAEVPASVPAFISRSTDSTHPGVRRFIGHTGAATVYTPVEVK